MFKVKSNVQYPECPRKPMWHQMLEDLALLSKSDVVIQSQNVKGERDLQPELLTDVTSNSESDNRLKMKHLYNMASEFIENIDQITTNLNDLQEQSLKLRNISEKLSHSVEKVKRQARTTISDTN